MERRRGMTHSLRTRLFGVLAGLAMTAGLLTATGSPAAAEARNQYCNYDNSTFNACLTSIRPTVWHRWVNLTATLSAWMDTGRAQEIVNRCGGAIEATLWYGNQARRSMKPSAGWPQVFPGELGVSLYTEVVPDEDINNYDVYATIGYWDCLQGANGVWVHYRTSAA